MKKQFEILDTYQDFLGYWATARVKPVYEQICLWQSSYMNKYQELFIKQVQSYTTENKTWQDIAQQVFSSFPARQPLMRKARDNILTTFEFVCTQAFTTLGIDFDIILVVYVGIGCGAGWATKYTGKPAILLGLENIAEEHWHTKTKLQGLISHEIGHLAHMEWRDGRGISEEKEPDPLFQLYREGFAQRCEHLTMGDGKWHMAPNKEWIFWCEKNKQWLAAEFLNRLSTKASVKDFFGSWFDIRGKKQTGYFLGYTFISELERTYSLKEMAVLERTEVRELAVEYLYSLSKD
ncbi:hypothetical protein ACFLWR_00965 [Chloroflexota bacterium]